MKNLTKKAFSIAELIVTNSIVLTLGSVGFVGMEGYIDGAKNVKVSHDLSSMLTKIEVTTLSGKQNFADLVITSSEPSTKNSLPNNATINGGEIINTARVQYNVGNINFVNLGEKQENFQDNQSRGYIFAYVATGNFMKTELAGSITDKGGRSIPMLKGTYYQVSSNDAEGLITNIGENNFEIVVNGGKQQLY